MTNKEAVLVTRRGQTTIPDKIRKKLNIHEGTRLKVETKGDKVIFSKIPSIFDLAGKSKGASFPTPGSDAGRRIRDALPSPLFLGSIY
jgi:AbrB family looped-hinge helix DNA binding protein